MEIQALVQKITDEVIKQLQGKKASEKFQSSKKVMVLSHREEFITQNMNPLETTAVEYLFLDECPQEKVKDMDYILLPTLSISSLAYIAAGIEGDEVSTRTIRGMLYGKEIFVLRKGMEHRNFEETSHPHFYQMYMDYEKKLEGFGVKIGNLKEMFSQSHQEIQSPAISIEEKEQAEEIFISGRVITEKGLKEIGCVENSRILIKTKAIITPMARDYIRTKKIQVVTV